MVKIQVDLNEEENIKVNILKAKWNDKDKRFTIRKIIRMYKVKV